MPVRENEAPPRPQDLLRLFRAKRAGLAIRTPNTVRHFRRASQHDWSVHN